MHIVLCSAWPMFENWSKMMNTKDARDFADGGDRYTGAEVRLWVHRLCDMLDAASKDAERYRKLCEVPGALDTFIAAYYNTQTKEQIDAAMDEAPDAGDA